MNTRRWLAVLLCLITCAPARAGSGSLESFTMMRRLARISELVPAGAVAVAAVPPKAREASPVRGATLYYPNGKVATFNAGDTGGTWYYPDGKVATFNAGQTTTWYWPNGQTASFNAGQVGATWYFSTGKVACFNAGQPDATWYYGNGQVLTFQGPGIAADELLNAPKFMLWLLWMNGGAAPPF